jgi:hypothetical protein
MSYDRKEVEIALPWEDDITHDLLLLSGADHLVRYVHAAFDAARLLLTGEVWDLTESSRAFKPGVYVVIRLEDE